MARAVDGAPLVPRSQLIDGPITTADAEANDARNYVVRRCEDFDTILDALGLS